MHAGHFEKWTDDLHVTDEFWSLVAADNEIRTKGEAQRLSSIYFSTRRRRRLCDFSRAVSFQFRMKSKTSLLHTHTRACARARDKRTSLQYSKQMQYINTNVAVKRNIKNAHEYSYNARTMKCFLLY